MAKNKITELRESKGWTQQDLADKTGISRVVISRYENNSTPSKGNLKKLIQVFQVANNFFTPSVVTKKALAKPVAVKDLKNRLNSVYNFSAEDQQKVLSVIELISEKMDLQSKLDRIKQL